MIAAVILAAGESRRMGSPKALVQFGGLTFVEHLLGHCPEQRFKLFEPGEGWTVPEE